jgi:adenylate cyclase
VAAFLAVAIKAHDGEAGDLLRWSEVIIYGASGEPAQGGVVTGSPLAMALGLRGFARWWHGRAGWRGDFEDGLAIARTADPATLGFVTAWRYGLSILDGAFRADDAALSNIENALHVAEASGDNQVLATANYVLGTALSFRQSATDRRRGRELLVQAREMCLQNQFPRSELPMIGAYLAYDKARDGDYEDALPLMRTSVDQISIQRHSVYLVGATGLLVEVLLSRAAQDDVAEADAAVERLAAIPGDEWVARDIMVLRLRTMLAKARGDDAGYRELRDRYRAQATTLGFEGHIQWAASMPDWISHPAPRHRS